MTETPKTPNSDESPIAREVRAGYVALAMWLGMCVAVALLGWSMFRQFRKVSAAKEAGVYDDPARPPGEPASSERDPSNPHI